MTSRTDDGYTVDPTIGTKTCATPCNMCPFLTKFDHGDRPFVKPGRRAEFINGPVFGNVNDFICHKSGEVDDETGNIERAYESVACAGARLTVLRAGHDTSNIRIEERLGMFDRDAFLARNERVDVWTWAQVQAELADDDDVETCEVVDAGCLAPAGYIGDGGIVRGTVAADNYCNGCGLPVCDNCMTGDLCNYCAEDEEE